MTHDFWGLVVEQQFTLNTIHWKCFLKKMVNIQKESEYLSFFILLAWSLFKIEDIKSNVGIIKNHKMVAWNLFYWQ